jgi:hypothetical protein
MALVHTRSSQDCRFQLFLAFLFICIHVRAVRQYGVVSSPYPRHFSTLKQLDMQCADLSFVVLHRPVEGLQVISSTESNGEELASTALISRVPYTPSHLVHERTELTYPARAIPSNLNQLHE